MCTDIKGTSDMKQKEISGSEQVLLCKHNVNMQPKLGLTRNK